jgi:hypothetical protein
LDSVPSFISNPEITAGCHLRQVLLLQHFANDPVALLPDSFQFIGNVFALMNGNQDSGGIIDVEEVAGHSYATQRGWRGSIWSGGKKRVRLFVCFFFNVLAGRILQ